MTRFSRRGVDVRILRIGRNPAIRPEVIKPKTDINDDILVFDFVLNVGGEFVRLSSEQAVVGSGSGFNKRLKRLELLSIHICCRNQRQIFKIDPVFLNLDAGFQLMPRRDLAGQIEFANDAFGRSEGTKQVCPGFEKLISTGVERVRMDIACVERIII
ncbi:hypothetical protein L0244_26360 [bacterium]|nr:hypothetical protein [bacterium]